MKGKVKEEDEGRKVKEEDDGEKKTNDGLGKGLGVDGLLAAEEELVLVVVSVSRDSVDGQKEG